jgi:hypothetical protein
MSPRFERLKAQLFAYASTPLMRAGFVTGLKTITNAYLGYAVLGVPLLWVVYLSIAGATAIEGSIVVIILASIFVALAVGAVPALVLAALTGPIQVYALLRKPAAFSRRSFTLANLGTTFLLMLAINLIAWSTFGDASALAGLGFAEQVGKIFPLLLAGVFPGLVYIVAATWLGNRLFLEFQKTQHIYRGM